MKKATLALLLMTTIALPASAATRDPIFGNRILQLIARMKSAILHIVTNSDELKPPGSAPGPHP